MRLAVRTPFLCAGLDHGWARASTAAISPDRIGDALIYQRVDQLLRLLGAPAHAPAWGLRSLAIGHPPL